jgi:hypothetical protein
MLNARIMAVGAAVVAGTLGAPMAEAACDPRFAWTCSTGSEQTTPSAKAEPAPDRVQPATKRPAAKAKAAERKKADRKKHASSRKSRSAKVLRAEPRASPASKLHRPVSAATRRFREIVSPRPISSNPIDDLQKPRPDASALAASITYPAGASKLQTVPQTGGDGAAASAQDELNEIDLAAMEVADRTPLRTSAVGGDSGTAAVTVQIRDVARAATSDQPPVSTTWLQLIFVTWGGILTLVSVVRLFIG